MAKPPSKSAFEIRPSQLESSDDDDDSVDSEEELTLQRLQAAQAELTLQLQALQARREAKRKALPPQEPPAAAVVAVPASGSASKDVAAGSVLGGRR